MKIEISEINKIKLEAIQKSKKTETTNDALTLVITAYVATLTDEQAKELINTL